MNILNKLPVSASTLYANEEGTKTYVEVEEQTQTSEEVTDSPVDESPDQKYSGAARVGSDVREGNFSDPFAGTTWGNS